MAREQTRDPQQQHATATMLTKQACALTLKLLPLVTHNSTGSVVLPGKAPELINIMERTVPWTLRLDLLRLVVKLPCHQKLQILMSNGGPGLDCLHGWFQAASNTAEEAKREALQLALLQTCASLARAHNSLVQPWMLRAADQLAASCPLHTVRLAAMKFKRLTEVQAGLQDLEESSSTGSNRLMYAALSLMLFSCTELLQFGKSNNNCQWLPSCSHAYFIHLLPCILLCCSASVPIDCPSRISYV